MAREQTFTVHIDSLRFHGYHGVTEEEQKLGVQLLADITAEYVAGGSDTDDMDNIVSYVDLGQLMIQVSGERNYRTLETLAKDYCDRVMRRWASIRNLEVTIAKPNPPTRIHVDAVGVSCSRSR